MVACVAMIVHCTLLSASDAEALLNKMHIWIERVPSEENISDLPSRESHQLLRALGAQWKEPMVAKLFLERSLIDGAQLCLG